MNKRSNVGVPEALGKFSREAAFELAPKESVRFEN